MSIPPSGYVFRSAIPEETSRLRDIERAAATLFPPDAIPEQHFRDTVPEGVLKEALRDGRLWVAADASDAPVGFALMEVIHGAALLAEMDVHPDHGAKGVGSALLEFAVGQAKNKGFCGLFLTTFRQVPWNAPFYEKHGFSYLAPKEAPRFMREILREEEACGMRDRVAMHRPLVHG